MQDTKKPWSLSEFKLFESLPKEDLEQIDQMATRTNFTSIPKGTLIQTPEVNSKGLSIVVEGRLRLFKTNADGKQYTVGILGTGGMYGESKSYSFGTNGSYMEAMVDTTISSTAYSDASFSKRAFTSSGVPEIKRPLLANTRCNSWSVYS